MKRYIRATSEPLDYYRVTNYRGYDIIRILYGEADYGDSGDEYNTWNEHEEYSIGYDKNAPTFDTLEAAKRYIDDKFGGY